MNELSFLYGMLHELKASPLHNAVSSFSINKVLDRSLQTCRFSANRHVKSVLHFHNEPCSASLIFSHNKNELTNKQKIHLAEL